MGTYYFTVVLAGLSEVTEQAAEELYKAGCDDCLPGDSESVAVCRFHRDAKSLHTAIRSAVADVKKAGYEVAKVEIEREDLQNLLDAPAEQNA